MQDQRPAGCKTGKIKKNIGKMEEHTDIRAKNCGFAWIFPWRAGKGLQSLDYWLIRV